ncbi:MAG: 50S ribosomal protein L11 methyltransferase [Ignavibacteriaceae bacterium]|nr:50S ribosomal protein L11 methyltransferase [Ignavibacteriaceae bacterium]
MKKFKEFIITADPYNDEILSSLLWQLNIDGINEEVNCIKVFVAKDSPVSMEEIETILNIAIREKLLRSFTIEENIIEDRNWNEEWEKSINVIEVSDKIIIKPTFREYEKKAGQIIITIDPKMSFGTGEHQTTKLVLRLIEDVDLQNKKVLDVGSGTGVLAIASVKLGAASAIAVDNDEWCLYNARENCQLNNCTENVKVLMGEIKNIDDKNFDIILANIQKNILLLIKDEIALRLKKEGVLILSGLLENDEEDIVREYSLLGFKKVLTQKKDDWIALKLIKN